MSGPKFGRTVADVRRFAAEAEVIMVAVRIARDVCDYFVIDQKTLMTQLDTRKPGDQMPCELAIAGSGRRKLMIGTWDSVIAAEESDQGEGCRS